jgi:thiol-disulfide isomerase/thioredoxin
MKVAGMRALLLCLSLCLPCLTPAVQADELSIRTRDDTDLSLQRYPAQGQYLLIWLAAGNGLDQREIQLARDLAEKHIEVWQIDFADALFQPHGNQQLRDLNPDYVADLITAAHGKTGKQILLAAHAYGAIPVINGIHRWQSRRPRTAYLRGALLFTPELYTGAPELGKDPEFIPTIYATRVPLFIYQDAKHHTTWQLPRLLHLLENNAAPVYVKLLQGVTGLFYSSDESAATEAALFDLPVDISRHLRLLTHTSTPLTALPLPKTITAANKKLDSKLVAFTGNSLPPRLDLPDIAGKHYLRADYRGKVTVVNFWATWCPPCVEEIPSFNRLSSNMRGEKFELISINYSEEPERIRNFLQQVKVEFPVLVDTGGSVAAQWHVYVFPSTFVIGPDGKIQYGVNAALPWDAPEILQKLRALLPRKNQR